MAKDKLPEAPASATAKIVTDNGFSWLFTMRDDKIATLVEKIGIIEKSFKKLGWRPAIEVYKEDKKKEAASQQACDHSAGYDKREVKKEGPNKGKSYLRCKACGTFVGWAA